MGKIGWYLRRIRSYVSRPNLIVQEKPVVLDDRTRCESPLFIVGVHRSGTSLVRRMFNSHPAIACPPESFFMKHYVGLLDDPLTGNGYEAFGYDRAEMRADLARKASELHEAYRVMQGKELWADKTPQYTAILNGLDRLFDRKARFLLVLRHPGDIVFSNLTRGWRHNDIPDAFESAVEHVRVGIENMLAFEGEHPERCARLHYDRLCDDPAGTLADTMARLGLEFHPQMLEFGQGSHNYGLEDAVIRGTKTVIKSSSAWRSLTKRQIERLVEVFGRAALTESYWN